MSQESWLAVAGGQTGLITSAQLRHHGISDYRRRQLVVGLVLEPRGRGLWAVAGWPDSWPRALWEAVLRVGPAAIVFRRSAAGIWGMDGVRPGTVELAVPGGRQSRTSGVHRLQSITAIDVTRHAHLPITTVSRTLVDLGRAVSLAGVERATEWALRNRLVGLAELEQISQRLARSGGHGLAKVLALRPTGSPPTESDAETLFLQLVRGGGYPDPIRQHPVLLRGRRYRLDFAWPGLRLAVEIDGAGVHGPDALLADLRRQNRIILDGWLILRFTWEELVRGRREVEDDLRAAWRLRGAFIPPLTAGAARSGVEPAPTPRSGGPERG